MQVRNGAVCAKLKCPPWSPRVVRVQAARRSRSVSAPARRERTRNLSAGFSLTSSSRLSPFPRVAEYASVTLRAKLWSCRSERRKMTLMRHWRRLRLSRNRRGLLNQLAADISASSSSRARTAAGRAVRRPVYSANPGRSGRVPSLLPQIICEPT